MPDPSSITLAGDVTKPATVLIEKIADAIGVVYEPTRVKRLAEAEAAAELIRAKAEIERGQLADRALEQLVAREAKKQQNIEQITAEAISELPADAQVERLEEDWVAHFFKKCDSVSDEDMQTLWGRLLAGEATRPGSYSRRTINLVESLDKSDAELFTTFCQFMWLVGQLCPMVFDHDNQVFKDAGIRFPEVRRLEEAGLITFNQLAGFARGPFGKQALVLYFGKPIVLEFPKNADNKLSLGSVLLTDAGQQLARISGAKPNERYFEYVIEHWVSEKLAPRSPLPDSRGGSTV